jgi:hypothetical protein
MVQRLVHPSDVVGCETSGYWLDTFPFAGQQQAGAIVLQGSVPIGMPCGGGQTLDICRKA